MNCRTPSSWESDLALSLTHFPRQGTTFAVLYGSNATIERQVVERLQFIGEAASHPLLLPGILAELELQRHTRLVEKSINDVEARIFELSFQSTDAGTLTRSQIDARNELKRNAWLDLNYLRNSLSTWIAQLQKIALISGSFEFESLDSREEPYHTTEAIYDQTLPSCKGMQLPKIPTPESEEQLTTNLFRIKCTSTRSFRNEGIESEVEEEGRGRNTPDSDETCVDGVDAGGLKTRIESQVEASGERLDTPDSDKTYVRTRMKCADAAGLSDDYLHRMMKVNVKIKSRLDAIIDNYDEKIRDCTMRVDGMAMATQWVSLSPLPSSTELIIARRIARQRWKLHWRQIQTRRSCDRFPWLL